MTPAGREREELTGLLLDHPDQEYVREVLEDRVERERLRHIRTAKRINGGGAVDNRDLCAELSNMELREVWQEITEGES